MRKPKRKLTRAEKAEKARRRAEFMTIFVNGKQKRVRRPVLIEGLTPEEFIARNADDIWLHQEGMWEYITSDTPVGERVRSQSSSDDRGAQEGDLVSSPSSSDDRGAREGELVSSPSSSDDWDDEIPF